MKDIEELREEFKSKTHLKLWAESDDAGFSDEYVRWLEQKVLGYARV